LPNAVQAKVRLWVLDKVVPNLKAGAELWHDRNTLNVGGPEAVIVTLTNEELDAKFLQRSDEDKVLVTNFHNYAITSLHQGNMLGKHPLPAAARAANLSLSPAKRALKCLN
jgi:hypothetical protein